MNQLCIRTTSVLVVEGAQQSPRGGHNSTHDDRQLWTSTALHTDPRLPTFEGLVELLLPEHDAQVVDGACVELNPEYHVAGRAAVPLVVALQLEGGCKEEGHED